MKKQESAWHKNILEILTSEDSLVSAKEAYLEYVSYYDLFQGEIFEYINNGEFRKKEAKEDVLLRFLIMCRVINAIQADLTVMINTHLGKAISEVQREVSEKMVDEVFNKMSKGE